MTNDWDAFVTRESSTPYFARLAAYLEKERQTHRVFPAEDDVFAALRLTPLASTRVVLLGQDPYHGEGQAHGLCFSVRRGVALPPSLRNILTELHDDVGADVPLDGDLTAWAERGVLLLNTTLTVREGEPGSHRGRGWETFTDAVISAVNEKSERTVFVLWGAHARSKRALVTNREHVVLESAHPSPLSAHRGFLGSRPFSRVNDALVRAGLEPVDWALPGPHRP